MPAGSPGVKAMRGKIIDGMAAARILEKAAWRRA